MIKWGMQTNRDDPMDSSADSSVRYSGSSTRISIRNRSNSISHLLRFGWVEFVLALFLAFMVWLVLFLPAQASETGASELAANVNSAGPETFAPPTHSIYLPMSFYNAASPLQPIEPEPDATPPTNTPEPEPTPVPTGEPTAEPTVEPAPLPTPAPDQPECGLNGQEAALEQLFLKQPEQKRVQAVCHPILAEVARARAADLAQREYFAHVNPDGHGSNYLVTQAGYVLPDWYPDSPDANNIESIGAGYTTPQAVWDAWMVSPAHRRHLLADDGGDTIEFYAEQVAYGIGYWEEAGSPYRHYWVVITAPPMSPE